MKTIIKLFRQAKTTRLKKTINTIRLREIGLERDRAIEKYHSIYYAH